MSQAITPMMKQYREAKQACPDALLLFRMGDFYELFHEDAKIAARMLNLTLTSREKGAGAVPMAGFPHHQLDNYLAKVIAAGMRVAVCEQVEDPKKAKGLVRRKVTRIVSPGTVTDEALLDPRQNNYLAAVASGEPVGLAWVELSTGRFVAAGFPPAQLADQLARIAPAECLLDEDAQPLPAHLGEQMMVTRRPGWAFSRQTADERVNKQFGTVGLEGFGFTSGPSDLQAIRAAGAILDYLSETQEGSLDHVERLIPYRTAGTLEIDEASRRSLEISRTIRHGRRAGSLLAVLDRTVTAMGSRLLADWMANPLTESAGIEARLDAVEELIEKADVAAELQTALKRVHDIQRLLGRVSSARANPRDLSLLGQTLKCLPTLKARLAARQSGLLKRLEAQVDLCEDLCDEFDATLVDDCPASSSEGGYIRAGCNKQLDSLRDLTRGGKQWIAAYQANQARATGIANLKVGFNKVFGYYIEVTNTHGHKVPEEYIRKQTLKNAERYITPELKEHEEQVLTAAEKAKDLEHDLFVELCNRVVDSRRRIQAVAAVLAQVDVLVALSDLARRRNYTRPKIVDEPVLDVVDGRHPVLDVIEPEGSFVPNDTHIGGQAGTILLITGPNMAGKSTYIRQVALITLMAQIGSFVPAGKATIGIADRIFARVGASDELSRGQSTFMVEMTETARILNTASRHSLVILDEIGRGTSTYDGISLAWSVVEHLQQHVSCRTLFATHYHELTDLEKSLAEVKNLNVAVREWQDEVVFLHKIVEGPADKSYGIHVARLAGVPRQVIERSKDILSRLEDEHLDSQGRARLAQRPGEAKAAEIQLTLFGPAEHPLVDELRRVDLNQTTPIDALALLKRWQDVLKKEKKQRG